MSNEPVSYPQILDLAASSEESTRLQVELRFRSSRRGSRGSRLAMGFGIEMSDGGSSLKTRNKFDGGWQQQH